MEQAASQKLITRAGTGQACDLCGNNDDVASMEVVWESEGPNPSGASAGLFVCARCCAEAIERTTGWRLIRLLDSMYRARANASNMRMDKGR